MNQKSFRGATPLMGAAVGRNAAVVKRKRAEAGVKP